MKVVVLHGRVDENAPSDELDVLIQADEVSRALSELGHDPIPVTFSFDIKKVADELRTIHPDLVFNLVESVDGRGRFIHIAPALLDYLNLPYTGSPTEAMFMTSNKLVAKKILRAAGISTPLWFADDNIGNDATAVGGPFIIKSVWEHASIGLSENCVVHAKHPRQLRQEMNLRREQLREQCFAEAYIEGREFNLSLLAREGGPQVLPPAEIHFLSYPPEKLRIVDYEAKWDAKSFAYHHTPPSFDFPDEDSPLLQQLVAIARDCWNVFALRGYARVDFRVDADTKPWVLEVNANPCLSLDAGLVAAAERAGLSFNQVIERIIGDSVPRIE